MGVEASTPRPWRRAAYHALWGICVGMLLAGHASESIQIGAAGVAALVIVWDFVAGGWTR